MRNPGFSYFVNAFCVIGIMFVIHGGFVPILGASPFIWLAFFIVYPIFYNVDEHYNQRNCQLTERRRHMLREIEERVHKRAVCKSCGDFLKEQGHRALPVTVKKPEFSTTDCVLTDQIFEAARRKGINPENVIGRARECEGADA